MKGHLDTSRYGASRTGGIYDVWRVLSTPLPTRFFEDYPCRGRAIINQATHIKGIGVVEKNNHPAAEALGWGWHE